MGIVGDVLGIGGWVVLAFSVAILLAEVGRFIGIRRAEKRLKKVINSIEIGRPYG